MNTLASLFKQLAHAADSNNHSDFQASAKILFSLLDNKYKQLFEDADDDFLNAYAQIVDYEAGGSFTIEKDEALALIERLAWREDMKEKSY